MVDSLRGCPNHSWPYRAASPGPFTRGGRSGARSGISPAASARLIWRTCPLSRPWLPRSSSAPACAVSTGLLHRGSSRTGGGRCYVACPSCRQLAQTCARLRSRGGSESPHTASPGAPIRPAVRVGSHTAGQSARRSPRPRKVAWRVGATARTVTAYAGGSADWPPGALFPPAGPFPPALRVSAVLRGGSGGERQLAPRRGPSQGSLSATSEFGSSALLTWTTICCRSSCM